MVIRSDCLCRFLVLLLETYSSVVGLLKQRWHSTKMIQGCGNKASVVYEHHKTASFYCLSLVRSHGIVCLSHAVLLNPWGEDGEEHDVALEWMIQH